MVTSAAEERIRALAARFIGRLPERLAMMENALGAYRVGELERHLHSLAGTAGTYRLNDIAALAAKGETLCSRGASAERLRLVIDDLARAIAQHDVRRSGHAPH